MCSELHHPWGFTTGLECLGSGPAHVRQYAASDANDGHDASESLAEQERA